MSDPSAGDGVIDVNLTTENEEMAIDLAPNVAQLLFKSGAEAYQTNMADLQINGSHTHNMARLISIKKTDELGPVEGRSVSGVLATPVASPAVQQQ